MEESKNRLNDFYNTNKLGKFFTSFNRKYNFVSNPSVFFFVNYFRNGEVVHENATNTATNDGDDECADTIGETHFTKPVSAIRPTRSSTLLHSVEDLSTDSTCVYKSHSGYDSNRGSRRRIITQKFGARLSNDELPEKMDLDKLAGVNSVSAIQTTTNRGLSKSMILPTPASDLCDRQQVIELKKPKTLCEKIQRYVWL